MRSQILKFRFTVIFAVLLGGGCSYLSDLPSEDSKEGIETVSTIPFSVKEPERFSSEVSVKSFVGDEAIERNYFVARDGEKHLQRFAIGTSGEFAILHTGKNYTFRLDPLNKEFERMGRVPVSAEQNSLMRSFTSRWLNEKRGSNFYDLGVENGLRKYRVEIDGSQNTEILIFVDENLKFPVRQEFHAVDGDKRRLAFLVELRNTTTEPDDDLFAIPEDYREKATL